MLRISLTAEDSENRFCTHRRWMSTICFGIARTQVRNREAGTISKHFEPLILVHGCLTHGDHIHARFAGTVVDRLDLVHGRIAIQFPPDRAHSAAHVDDTWRRGRFCEQWSEFFDHYGSTDAVRFVALSHPLLIDVVGETECNPGVVDESIESKSTSWSDLRIFMALQG